MNVSGKSPPGDNEKQHPSAQPVQAPPQKPQTHRNSSEPAAIWSWNEKCGKQLELLIGRRGYTYQGFAQEMRVSEKALYKWRKAESEPTASHKAEILVHLDPGGEGSIWDDPAFRELGICLGARPAPPSEDVVVHPIPPKGTGWSHLTWMALSLVIVALTVIAPCDPVSPPTQEEDHPSPAGRLTPETPVRLFVSAGAPWLLELASGQFLPLEATPRNGGFGFDFADSLRATRLIDLDADGSLEAVVVCLDTSRPEHRSGQVRIACYSAAGTLRWTHWIDDAPEFGAASSPHSAHGWTLEDLRWLDWNGDGKTEILLLTTHTMYPSLLVVLDAEGKRLAEYMHAGHLRGLALLPNRFYEAIRAASGPFQAPTSNGPGPALALSAEFQEAPRTAGLVILAPGFRSGAYPAQEARFRHARMRPMEDAIYVRTPPSLVAQRCDARQNWPGEVLYDETSRSLQLLTIEEPGGEGILRMFDSALRQTRIIPTDRFKNRYVSLKSELDLPAIDSAAMSHSVEISRFWFKGEWVDQKTPGVWSP